MLVDESNSNAFPKTLFIRNSVGGMIWQVYHVQKLKEAEILSHNATMNGFESCILENHNADYEETFPNWRNECDFV